MQKIDTYFITYQENTVINSVFKQKSYPIVFAVDEHYLSYLAVAIQSIIKNSSKENNYEIFILHCGLDFYKMKQINHMVYEAKNISIRFINIQYFIEKQTSNGDLFYACKHFSVAMFYRFFIPYIFENYKKVLYLDADIVVLKDLKLAFDEEFEEGQLMAVVKDLATSFVAKISDDRKEMKYRASEIVNNMDNYFLSGFLLYNILECNNNNFVKLCINSLQKLKKTSLPDQDVLNNAFEGRVKYLSSQWSFLWFFDIYEVYKNFRASLDTKTLKDFKQAEIEPYIIQYAGVVKPWSAPHIQRADIWWCYARQTPFYEEIIFANTEKKRKIYYAPNRVQNQLSYKLGSALLRAKNPFYALCLPITLPYITLKHKFQHFIFNQITSVNTELKLPNLNTYADYEEAIKTKEHLSYKLGNALLKNPFTFIFKAKGIYKAWKRDKER